jgi:hypothetical protein
MPAAQARLEQSHFRSGDSIMRKFIGTTLLLALLSSRTAIAETVGLAKVPAASASLLDRSSPDLRLAGGAPIGHRQPQARDVPSENPSDIEHISEADRSLDRKLIICRGC